MTWVDSRDIKTVGSRMRLAEFLSPTVFMLENGSVGSVIALKSESVSTHDSESIRAVQALWHQLIVGLNEQTLCLLTEYRRKINLGITQKSDNSFLSDLISPQINGEYYQQDLFLTLICQPSLINRKAPTALSQERLVIRLEQQVQLGLSLLAAFKPGLLSNIPADDSLVTVSDVLSLVVNGGYGRLCSKQQRMGDPQLPVLLEEYLGDRIAERQLLIGRHITFLGMTADENKLGALISIKRYPSETQVQKDCALSCLDFEWIRVHGFEPLAKDNALKSIQKQRAKLQSVADKAVSQRNALSVLEDQVAGERVSLGHHQYSVLVLADNEKELDKNITQLQACLIEQGFQCVREALGLESAFWAMQAGGLSQGIRKALITSVNFSHLCPIRGFSSGHSGSNHLGRPICLLETREKTPYYFNFHVTGSSSNPSLGHTLILGSSNSGKTVLLTYLDAMRSNLGGWRFFFDRDKGAYLYFKAMGGAYLSFDPSQQDLFLNPFSLADTSENRYFLVAWLEQIALAQMPGRELAPKERAALRSCVDYGYEQLNKEQRFLSNILRILPRNYPYIEAFKPWLKDSGNDKAGEFHRYFDNVEDTLAFSRATAFDMTYLLDQAPPLLRQLVLMYIFHRIEGVCCGELVTITLDEGWQYFADPYWRSRMNSWLPTLRKLNAHVVIATQSPSSILQSSVKDIVLDNCPTQLYFGNDKANEKIYVDALKLSQEELQVIRHFVKSEHWMLLKHANDSVVVRLNLAKKAKYLPVLSSNAETISRFENLCDTKLPANWSEVADKLGSGV